MSFLDLYDACAALRATGEKYDKAKEKGIDFATEATNVNIAANTLRRLLSKDMQVLGVSTDMRAYAAVILDALNGMREASLHVAEHKARKNKLVIIESPYAGPDAATIRGNVAYAQACMLHSLSLGEAPLASHLLYTQVLDDHDPAQRSQGINAGLAWRVIPGVLPAFYVDRGHSSGMLTARDIYDREQQPYETRRLPREFYDQALIREARNGLR